MLPPQVLLAQKAFGIVTAVYRGWTGMPEADRQKHRAQAGVVASLTLELGAAAAKAGWGRFVPRAALNPPADIPIDRTHVQTPRSAGELVGPLLREGGKLLKALGIELTGESKSKRARALGWALNRAAKLDPHTQGLLARAGLTDDAEAIEQLRVASPKGTPAGERPVEISRVEVIDVAADVMGTVLLVVRATRVQLIGPAPAGGPPPRVLDKPYADYRGPEVAEQGGPCLMFKPGEGVEPFLLSWAEATERDRMLRAIVDAWSKRPVGPDVSTYEAEDDDAPEDDGSSENEASG